MKILVICHEFPPISGGGGIAASKVALELSKNHQVDVITPYYLSTKKVEKVNKEFTIHRIKVLGRVNAEEVRSVYLTIISFLSFIISGIIIGLRLSLKTKYHIIHSYFIIPSGVIGMIISLLTGIPYTTTIIEADIFDVRNNCLHPYKNILIRYIISIILKRAARVITISSYNRDAIYRFYSREKEVYVINYGLDEPQYNPVEKLHLGLNSEDFFLISISRLVKRKGVEYLIKAMNEIKEDKIKLLIIGEGPELYNLMTLTKKLNIEKKVIFLGNPPVEKKWQYLSISDLFVSATLHEGLGIVYLEAMYFGLPIVTTNVGGQTDLIVDNENGFLVPSGDVKKLSEKIMLLYENKALYNLIKRNNLKKIKNYTIESETKKYYQIFLQVMKEKNYVYKL